MVTPQFPPLPATRPSWFSNNKLWFIPLILLLVVGLPAGCTLAVFFAMAKTAGAISSVIKDSDVVWIAIERTNAHPVAAARLGTPIKAGGGLFGFTGNISQQSGGGNADLAIAVEGPKGKGQLVIKATRSNGVWTYQVLELAPEDGSPRIKIVGGQQG